MRIVVALGGNALLRRGEPQTAANQLANVRVAARSIAELARGHEVIVTHGNGPQIGLLALESLSNTGHGETTLDVLGAESQGMIGYLIEVALRNELPAREIVTVLGQVVVDADDVAFERPSKPIGPIVDDAVAARWRAEHGWTLTADGEGWRRVVPSPKPRQLLEAATVSRLADAGVLVICAGGGGVPVTIGNDGRLFGVEAVVDKDLTASLLAERIGADQLLLLTDVPAIVETWERENARAFRLVSPEVLRAFAFAPGSMGPKVAAACGFVEQTGRPASVGALSDAARIVAGIAGSTVKRGQPATVWW